jgi:hypothetical protein
MVEIKEEFIWLSLQESRDLSLFGCHFLSDFTAMFGRFKGKSIYTYTFTVPGEPNAFFTALL